MSNNIFKIVDTKVTGNLISKNYPFVLLIYNQRSLHRINYIDYVKLLSTY